MNIIAIARRFNATRDARQRERRERLGVTARLEATLRPDPDYRRRKFAQWGPERIAQYHRATAGL